MSEEDIEAMYRFDLVQFNRDLGGYESRRRPLRRPAALAISSGRQSATVGSTR